MAARKIREKSRKIAAHLLEAREDDLEWEPGKFFVRGNPARAKTIQEIALAAYTNHPQGMEAAQVLVKIGKAVDFQVILIDSAAVDGKSAGADLVLTRVEKERLPPCRERYAVIATMGNWDDHTVMELLALGPDYIGVIASKKRFRQMMQSIHPDGISQEKLDSIRRPAGLDFPVRTLQEIALSIVAEIVTIRRRSALQAGPVAVQSGSTMVEDSVCHMTVDARIAQTTFELEVRDRTAGQRPKCQGERERFDENGRKASRAARRGN